jgi:hypothetical protein
MRNWVEAFATKQSDVLALCALLRNYFGFVDLDTLFLDVLRRYGGLADVERSAAADSRLRMVEVRAVPEDSSEQSAELVYRNLTQDCRGATVFAVRAIRACCLSAEARKQFERLRLTVSRTGLTDAVRVDINALALAFVEQMTEEDGIAPSYAWRSAVIETSLGQVDFARHIAVRHAPRAWIAVVLGAFGIIREVLLAQRAEDKRQADAMRLWFPFLRNLESPADGLYVLKRIVRASLPVLLMRPKNGTLSDASVSRTIFVPVLYFPGLDKVLKKEKLLEFSAFDDTE